MFKQLNYAKIIVTAIKEIEGYKVGDEGKPLWGRDKNNERELAIIHFKQ